MSTDEYAPSEAHFRDYYVGGRSEYDPEYTDDMAARRDWGTFLARVRRDAAREALDGLIGALNTSVHEIQNGPTPNPVAWQTGALWTRDLAKIRRDARYPEETP